jgi:hypothetical protein
MVLCIILHQQPQLTISRLALARLRDLQRLALDITSRGIKQLKF